jgi:hypothetical protein
MKKDLWGLLLLLVVSSVTAFAQQVAPTPDTNQTPQQQPASQAQAPPASPAAQAPVAPLGKPVLEDGTPVKLRLTRNVSSADARVGDTVDFEVLAEVRVGDLLVVPKGGVAWASITEAQAKRRMARGGKLGVNIDSVRLIDGEKVALRAVREAKGGGHTGAMTAAMVGTAIVFFPAAPLFLFMHGKDITIPKGTEITAYISGNVPLDLAKFAPPKMPEVVPESASATRATVQIDSDPAGADIELDGAFAGNTPSSVGVPAGEHAIKITRAGYKAWERKVRISSGSVKIAAELEKQEVAPPASESK